MNNKELINNAMALYMGMENISLSIDSSIEGCWILIDHLNKEGKLNDSVLFVMRGKIETLQAFKETIDSLLADEGFAMCVAAKEEYEKTDDTAPKF